MEEVMYCFNEKDNAQRCLSHQVDDVCHRKGIALTPAARQRAIEHAVSQWNGNTLAGDAAEAGVAHVTDRVIRHR